MSKHLTTKTTIERLAAELKTKFAAVNDQAALSFKSLGVEGSTVSFYTTSDKYNGPLVKTTTKKFIVNHIIPSRCFNSVIVQRASARALTP